MSHSCICNGENENCRYCHGSGTMEDRLRPAFDETLRRRAIEESPTEDIKASPRPLWPIQAYDSVSVPFERRCPKGCGRWVEIHEVQSHLANCNGARVAPGLRAKHRPPDNAIAEETRSAQTTSDKDPVRQVTTLASPRDRNLDATKQYAHTCREQGKYGSHPSHDGFDDESGPD
jgi:hypothetical protein